MSTTQRESRKPARTPVEALNPLGERIRERRKELGLSLEEVAARTQLTASFLSLIERNINHPSLDSLYRIAEALEVQPFYFSADSPPATIAQNPVVRRDERIRITFPPGDVTGGNCWCPICAVSWSSLSRACSRRPAMWRAPRKPRPRNVCT